MECSTQTTTRSNSPDLLVLLITYSTEAETLSILSRYKTFISRSQLAGQVQVVVWDNKSWNLGSGGAVTYHSSPTGNIGFGAAVNQVHALYNYKRILLLNSDIEIDHELFEALIRRNMSLEDTVLWSPLLVNLDGTAQTTPDSLYMRTPLQEVFDIFGFPARHQRRKQPLYYLRGAVLSVSRRMMAAVGGFDESFFLYGEEADLCFRLTGRCDLIMDEDLRVVHHGSQGNKGKSPDALRHSYKARVLLHRKYNGVFAASIVQVAVSSMKFALRVKGKVSPLAKFDRVLDH